MSTRMRAVLLAVAAVASATCGAVDSIVYDQGTEWKVFRSEGPSLRFALEGATLWQATETKVMSVNTKTAAFTSLSTLGSLSAAGVRAMCTDSSGTVWIGTADGLARRSGNSWEVFTAEKGMPKGAVNALLAVRDAVWVATEEGAGMFAGNTWKAFTKETGLRGNQAKALEVDGRGAVWIGTNAGISIYNQGAWSSQSMDNDMSWNDTRALAFDQRKLVMWAAVGEQDINTYDGKSWSVYTGVAEGITSIMVDTQSRVWLGTSGGLQKFNGEEWQSDQQKLGVPAKLVTQMLRDRNGNLWFACENGVVYLKNPYPF